MFHGASSRLLQLPKGGLRGIHHIPKLLPRLLFGPAQPHIEPDHPTADIDSVVQQLRFGQIQIRHMHVSRAECHAVFGVEVVPDAAAQHESKSEILSLCPFHGSAFRVDEPRAEPELEVRRRPPVAVDKITPHPQIERPISRLRPSWNRSQRKAGRQVGIAPQNPGPPNGAHVPPQRREDGNKRVMKWLLRVIVVFEDIEDKRNVDGERSRLERQFQLVSVVDVFIEIVRLRSLRNLGNCT